MKKHLIYKLVAFFILAIYFGCSGNNENGSGNGDGGTDASDVDTDSDSDGDGDTDSDADADGGGGPTCGNVSGQGIYNFTSQIFAFHKLAPFYLFLIDSFYYQ